jgi:hypothetical protein
VGAPPITTGEPCPHDRFIGALVDRQQRLGAFQTNVDAGVNSGRKNADHATLCARSHAVTCSADSLIGPIVDALGARRTLAAIHQ